MTKTELLTDLSATYKSVLSVTLIIAESGFGVNRYVASVYEEGKSEENKKPTGYKKNVYFYVYNEGLGDESAAYERFETSNSVNNDITTSAGDLYSISKIFSSNPLRNRIKAAIITVADEVLLENKFYSYLSANATSGQKIVYVTSGEGISFYEGKAVVISDDNKTENNIILRINNNKITMVSALSNTYYSSATAKLAFLTNDERVAWAGNALSQPLTNLDIFSAFISLDPIIQANGGTVNDSRILEIVRAYVTQVSIALGFTK